MHVDRPRAPSLCYLGKKWEAAMAYSYRCRDYPGNEACPAKFTAETEAYSAEIRLSTLSTL
jgi:hypothetical protein